MDIPDISKLHKEKDNKDKARNDIFSIVLNKCIGEINNTNKNTDKTFTYFNVPKIIIGFPTYDNVSCIMFLIKVLSNKNYIVDFIAPSSILIDWSSPINVSYKNSLRQQTENILKQFPNTNNIEFVYEDQLKKNKKKNKHI